MSAEAGRRRLAAVYAHPDDDTFGNAGVLALAGDTVEYTLVVATSGGAGMISDPSLATRENLTSVREAEQLAALDALGVPSPSVHFLGYPDGELAAVDRDELVGRIAEILRRARPDVVLTFGPEGVTRHDDHITIGAACTRAFERLRGGGGGFRRLLYNAIPESRLRSTYDEMRRRGIDVDPDAPFMPRGVPDDTIAVEVDCGAAWERKLAALRAHRTQAGEIESLPEDLRRETLGREFFVQAWPERRSDETRLRGVFELLGTAT